jgi:hypothetical protein
MSDLPDIDMGPRCRSITLQPTVIGRVEVPSDRHLPHRSRRAAFPHRAPVEGRTRPEFGAWAAHSPPARRLAAPVTCRTRRCVRGMRRDAPSLRPAAFPPRSPPPTGSALFEASSVLRSRPTPRATRVGDALPSFPARPATAEAAAGDRRSPRFRRAPFRRDVVCDSGGATAPRMMAPPMLPSTFPTVSASAT